MVEPLAAEGRMQSLIYGLIDPRMQMIFYVGKSERGLKRAQEHLRERKNAARRAVISSLQAQGLTYEVVILDVVEDPKSSKAVCWWNRDRNPTHLADVERWWIAMGRAMGWPLTNQTDGGEGASNRFTLEQRSLIANKIQATMSPERWRAARMKGNATLGPEGRKAASAKAHAAVSCETRARLSLALSLRNRTRTAQQKSESVRRGWSEDRRMRARERMTNYMAQFTPEQRSERARLSNTRTRKQRSESVYKIHASRTPEQRSEIVRKGHLSRRRSHAK